jgi:hypothetical protein
MLAKGRRARVSPGDGGKVRGVMEKNWDEDEPDEEGKKDGT